MHLRQDGPDRLNISAPTRAMRPKKATVLTNVPAALTVRLTGQKTGNLGLVLRTAELRCDRFSRLLFTNFFAIARPVRLLGKHRLAR